MSGPPLSETELTRATPGTARSDARGNGDGNGGPDGNGRGEETPPARTGASSAADKARHAGARLASGVGRLRRVKLSRRRIVDSTVIGILLTLAIAVIDSAGLLVQLERWFYDHRAAYCQYFAPPPTDRIVHLDIDDAALESIGRWPWHRAKLAELLDEVRLARPRAVGLDVIFPDPQLSQHLSADGVVRETDDGADAALAAAFTRLGNTVVPASISFEVPDPVLRAVRAELIRDLSLTPERVAERLTERVHGGNDPSLRDAATTTGGGGGVAGDDLARLRKLKPTELAATVAAAYFAARREAVFERINEEFSRELDAPKPATKQRIEDGRRRVLSNTAEGLAHPLNDVFDQQYARALATARVRRFLRPIPAGWPALYKSEFKLVPVAPLGEAAAYSGFVDYPTPKEGLVPDGKLRAIPMMVRCDGRMFPQMGLSLACAYLGIDVGEIRYDEGAGGLVIPRPDGQRLVIPTRTYHSDALGQNVPLLVDIPWVGGKEWATMYDSARIESKQHMSLDAVWAPCKTRRAIAKNNSQADGAITAVLSVLDEGRAKAYIDKPPPKDHPTARNKVIQELLAEARPFVEMAEEGDPKDLDERSRIFLASAKSLPLILSESVKLDEQLRTQRRFLRDQIAGRAALVGWTSSGVIADFLPTSIHDRCPGVVVHGTLFNGILTGEMWRSAPWWVTTLITLAFGLLTTAAVAYIPPARALVLAMVIVTAYLLVNGLLLFDYGNTILGVAGPVVVIGAVWQGGTLAKLVLERWERARITKRFRSYVDPALVDYTLAHPDQADFKGQVREMTVVFTDLGNFTPLTAKLGPATVTLLNEFLGLMVPVIRKHGGYVNKFLGDGIMFFYGAPLENPHHARDALATVMEMQAAMVEFNKSLNARGLPSVTLRAGISTGEMVVGDAGSADASDFTVLGDTVNLGARLESANKAVGTSCLLTERTIELAGDDGFLIRPIGRLAVVGRQDKDALMVYEALAPLEGATREQRELARMTRAVVENFTGARLRECLAAIDAKERAVGPNKITMIYRDRCEYYLRQATLDNFDSQIVLTEK